MKKTYLFGMFAALALASCSSESEPAANNGNGSANEGEAQYLAVNICSPASATRADEFQNGDENEDAVNNATFIIFNADGSLKQVMPATLTPWEGLGNYNPNVENISSAVLVINGVEKSDIDHYELLAVLNDDTDFINLTVPTGKTYKQVVLDIIGNYPTTGAKNSFVMTNSSYSEGTATKLSSANFANTAELAKLNPVEVYVERVVAKASAEMNSEFSIESTSLTLAGATSEITITPEIIGIEYANVAEKSYLFKNIANMTLNGWDDAANKRSYWANTPADVTLGNKSYNVINSNYTGEGNAFGKGMTYTEYLQENTLASTSTTSTKNTSVLVTAVLKQDNKPINLAYIAGQYTTPDGAATTIANFLRNEGYRIKTTEGETTTIRTINFKAGEPNNDIVWVSQDAWVAPEKGDEKLGYMAYMVPTASTGVQYVKVEGKNEDGSEKIIEEKVNIADVLKSDAYRVQYWNEGRCYYYMEIEHTTKDNAAKQNGVVRNHIYKLNLTGLAGLGTPVFNPDATIIPQKRTDDDVTFLAARVNILKWRIVGQNVKFDM